MLSKLIKYLLVRLKSIIDTPLFKVSSLNALSVLVKVGSGLIAAKILAIFIGPAGVYLTGNLRNTLGSLDTFTTLGMQTGVIKYTAENENDRLKLYRLLSTVFISTFIMAVVLSLLIFFLSGTLSDSIFGSDTSYSWVFKVLAFTLPWNAANIIFMAVINGLGKFKQVIGINIAGNIIGVAISGLLIWQLQLTGAFLGLIISPALLFVFSFYIIWKQFEGFPFLDFKNFDVGVVKRLLSYSLMSVVNAVLSQVIFITIRNTIASETNMDEAGFWESMNRISFFYLMFISTLLTVYFLPKLSVSKDSAETKSVFISYYKSIFPLFIAGCIIVYFLRSFIVKILFTSEFLPMENLFLWQLIGDVFKVASLILGTQFLAKRMTTAFIVTEITSFAVLYFSSIYLIGQFGSEGAVMAHAVTYIIYFIILCVLFRKILFLKP